MPNPEFQTGIAAFCVAALCLSTIAHASGQLPMPPTTEEFKSHGACVAALHALHKEDQKQVRPKSAKADGRTSEVELITGGIRRIGQGTARYDATIWYHHGSIRDDVEQRETSHSYAHRLRECEGRTMRVTGQDGYTLSTFEPLLGFARKLPNRSKHSRKSSISPRLDE
ncbi:MULTISPECIES: hypothetical protein [Rhizobium/Agrobacterium group]|jgi:hypothetical protein|uniref:Uncharacterized protein n=2 Tax=Neorhizobium TaxID=1525371 RepID=A0ABV0M359_9HYPH|nr:MULTISPECIES: hypothetical protein [Rhizobium/Agrobacterium group]KGD89161.1 hypothetical protein JL39_23310 [Rhizobium sp. YS-1r]MCC2609447.1 hypothetical protein [Neorhizobium petrolearium]WGI69656.1 hypothetical protein QEO92_06190 [Neorhizobium petrolearium]